MHNVARRGCPRTALELGRLLLSLAPERDPLHACLHLDHFALAAAAAAPADASWVLRLPRAFPAHGLLLYPNFCSPEEVQHLRGGHPHGGRPGIQRLLVAIVATSKIETAFS